ncbi:MAG: DNA-invertase [Pseudarthrobacter sp.]|nr:DNA-invertase [Pseudarthrobacter sp.]
MGMALVGYMRVSTADQNTDGQLDALLDALLGAGVKDDARHLFQDHGVSGAKASRPGFDKCLEALRMGTRWLLPGWTAWAGPWGTSLSCSRSWRTGAWWCGCWITPCSARTATAPRRSSCWVFMGRSLNTGAHQHRPCGGACTRPQRGPAQTAGQCEGHQGQEPPRRRGHEPAGNRGRCGRLGCHALPILSQVKG